MKRKKIETPFLDLHFYLLENGLTNGLCMEIIYLRNRINSHIIDYIFSLVNPESNDYATMFIEGKCSIYWSADLEPHETGLDFLYTELRQNLILLCACINEEY